MVLGKSRDRSVRNWRQRGSVMTKDAKDMLCSVEHGFASPFLWYQSLKLPKSRPDTGPGNNIEGQNYNCWWWFPNELGTSGIARAASSLDKSAMGNDLSRQGGSHTSKAIGSKSINEQCNLWIDVAPKCGPYLQVSWFRQHIQCRCSDWVNRSGTICCRYLFYADIAG